MSSETLRIRKSARILTSVIRHTRITDVRNHEGLFELGASNSAVVQARTIILATGLKETLPAIDGIHDYYGKSLFCCPYCDGWELKEKPLVVIAEERQQAFQMAKVVWNWSQDVLVCTNGHAFLTTEQKTTLQKKEIQVVEDPITTLVGKNGMLERVVFASHEESKRQGGFVAPQLVQASSFGALLGCDMNALGGIVTDDFGRTTVPGVYAAGDASVILPAQVIIAAASGNRAAAGVNTDLTEREFL
jgi:thioredoxin reductase